MDNTFKCDDCGVKFLTKESYNKHEQEHHTNFITKTPICRFFKQGRCTRQHCNFRHPQPFQQREQESQPFQQASQHNQVHQQQSQYQTQQNQNWREACRRGPNCNFLAQGRCNFFHSRAACQEQITKTTEDLVLCVARGL